MPYGVRWWNERAREFVEAKRRDEIGEHRLKELWVILRAFPARFEAVGISPPPTNPRAVRREHVRLWKQASGYATHTVDTYLTALRMFLRWGGNPLADEPPLWRVPSGSATRRRWLTAEQLGALFRAAEGRARVLVALEGFNGLRRVEVMRLHVRDLELNLPSPRMRVLGKGRGGGKWRTIPMSPPVYSVLLDWVAGRAPHERVYSVSETRAFYDLRTAGRAAGIAQPVSGHDLRRTFGRVAYEAGLSLVNIKHILGHESVDMTAHYIGLDETEMAAGLQRFTERMARELVAA